MRVLLVCNFKGAVGGISGQVLLLQQHLRAEGHVADLFSTRGSLVRRICLQPRLRRAAGNYDVVHIHCCSNFGFFPAIVGVNAAKRAGRRVVVTYHGGGAAPFFKKHKALVQRVLRRSDANIVLNRFLSEVFSRANIPHVLIPNIVDTSTIPYRPRASFAPRLICTRAHEPLYDLPTLLHAFAQVQAAVPEAELTLVGDGSQHAALRSLTEQLRLRHVAFIGRVPNDQIPAYLDRADLLISTSTVDNMPVSLLEGMAAGLLVLATAVGGVPELLADGRAGLLFAPADADGLAALLLQAFHEQPIAIAAAGHEVALQYSWLSVRQRIYATYGA